MSPLLEVRDLSVAYGGTAVLDKVSITLGESELLGLVGQSGSGKSTLALAILGVLAAQASVTGGEIRIRGQRVQPHGSGGVRPTAIAYVPQEPMSAMNPTVRVGRQIDWVLARRFPDRPAAQRRAQLAGALERMRVTEIGRILRSYPFELSGGQLQRCLLAQALAMEPELIIADEPTTALDVTVQADVLDLLELVARDTRAGVILVSHNVAIVWRLCPHIAVLWNGRIVESGETRKVVARPRASYTRALLDALPGRAAPRSLLPSWTPEAL